MTVSPFKTASGDVVRLEHSLLDFAKARRWTTVKEILDKNPEIVNAQPAGRWSVLHQAAGAGDIDIVRYLLIRGADVSAKNSIGKTPAEVATNEAVRKCILDHAHVDTKRKSLEHAFLDLAKKQRWGELKKMLLATPDLVDVHTDGRWSALQQASHANNVDIVTFLLEKRANASARTPCGRTAAELANSSAVKHLLSGRATATTDSPPKPKGTIDTFFKRRPSSGQIILDSDDEGTGKMMENGKRLRLGEATATTAGSIAASAGVATFTSGGAVGSTTAGFSSVRPSKIANNSGAFRLTSKAQVMKGSYAFDPSLGTLRTGNGDFVGTFSDGAISDKPFLAKFLQTPLSSSRLAFDSVHINEGEIMDEIHKPANAGAFFVLPSQLNGAEYPSNNMIIDAIDRYQGDNTGGPRGQLAVHPAAGQFVLDNAACDSRPDGIDAIDVCLQKTRHSLSGKECGLRVQNGYLRVPKCPEELHEQTLQALRGSLHHMRCLCMKDVPTCGLTPCFGDISTSLHRVSLIYASAVPIQAYLNNTGSKEETHFQEKVGRLIIFGQYYGALRLAAQSAPPRRKIYLMPLGGGVFNNRAEVIVEALSTAIEVLANDGVDITSCLDIHLLTFYKNPAERSRMEGLLRARAGDITSASPHAGSASGVSISRCTRTSTTSSRPPSPARELAREPHSSTPSHLPTAALEPMSMSSGRNASATGETAPRTASIATAESTALGRVASVITTPLGPSVKAPHPFALPRAAPPISTSEPMASERLEVEVGDDTIARLAPPAKAEASRLLERADSGDSVETIPGIPDVTSDLLREP